MDIRFFNSISTVSKHLLTEKVWPFLVDKRITMIALAAFACLLAIGSACYHFYAKNRQRLLDAQQKPLLEQDQMENLPEQEEKVPSKNDVENSPKQGEKVPSKKDSEMQKTEATDLELNPFSLLTEDNYKVIFQSGQLSSTDIVNFKRVCKTFDHQVKQSLSDKLLLCIQAGDLAKELSSLKIAADNFNNIGHYRNSSHTFHNLVLALTKYAQSGDLNETFAATETLAQFGGHQPNCIKETFERALCKDPMKVHGGFQATLQAVRKEITSPTAAQSKNTKDWEAFIEVCEKIEPVIVAILKASTP